MLPIIDFGIGTVCLWRVVEGEAGDDGGGFVPDRLAGVL